MSPPPRFNELPPYVQEWIANLRPEDIAEINDARVFIRKMKLAGSIWKFFFLAFFSAVIIIGSASEYLSRLLTWFRTPPGAP